MGLKEYIEINGLEKYQVGNVVLAAVEGEQIQRGYYLTCVDLSELLEEMGVKESDTLDEIRSKIAFFRRKIDFGKLKDTASPEENDRSDRILGEQLCGEGTSTDLRFERTFRESLGLPASAKDILDELRNRGKAVRVAIDKNYPDEVRDAIDKLLKWINS